MIITVNGSRVENLLFLLKQSAGKDGKHDPEKIIYIENYVENESDRDQAGTCHFSVIKMKREKESSKQELFDVHEATVRTTLRSVTVKFQTERSLLIQ